MDKKTVTLDDVNATLDRIAKETEKNKKEALKRDKDSKKSMDKLKKSIDAAQKAAEAKERALESLVKTFEAQVQKTFGGLEEVKAETKGISDSNGKFSESYFYYSLMNTMLFGGIDFDEIAKSVTRTKKQPDGTKIQGEYDVVLYNGDTIALIEIKYRVRKDDASDLINRKLSIFKQLFPHYANYSFYLGIAGLVFDEGTENVAKEHGIGILRPKGENVEIIDEHLKAY